jgi:transcription initiation factor IIE alpha subunit
MKYELDWILASGMSEEDLHNHVKKELAGKLAAKMMEDGHFSFTKQVDHADNSVRYKAYTWVGNKDFIEQQRKNKR